MSALEHITVKGYKSIRELELDLQPLNVLIGANGAGKSNLIGVFELLNQIVRSNLQVFVGVAGVDTLLYFGRKTTEAIDVKLTFFTATGQGQMRNGYHCQFVPTQDNAVLFAAEECWFHDRQNYQNPYVRSLGSGHRETQLFQASAQSSHLTMADHVIRSMKGWRVYHFHDTSATAAIKFPGELEDNADLRDDASNLAAFLYLLRERYTPYYQQIVKSIQLVAPFFDDFDLKPSRQNPDKIRLEWREKGSDAYFNAHALSDGTLRFMCLATLLQMPEPPATILIDEPELGLHPYAITLLAALLRSAATRTQVIVSTQSVTLVNQFAPEDIIVVDRKDGQSTFERPSAEALVSWLEEYGMGDLWEKNLLGGRPR